MELKTEWVSAELSQWKEITTTVSHCYEQKKKEKKKEKEKKKKIWIFLSNINYHMPLEILLLYV